jgi:hypothetical protein
MRTQLFLISLVALLIPIDGQSKSSNTSSVRAAVERVLHDQQDAWNRYDLQAFMAGYWNSPKLTFFSGAQRTSGWQGA